MAAAPPAIHQPVAAAAAAVVMLIVFPSLATASAAKLQLERASPLPRAADLDAIRPRDGARHARMLQSYAFPAGGVADFPVGGSSNPFTVGLYYTRVKLGNPQREFKVQIDTGSEILWVACTPCEGCPGSSGLDIELDFFDPRSSSTASGVSCTDTRCSSGYQTLEALCSSSETQSSVCGYSFQYGDGSGTSGYYVSDTLYFESILGDGEGLNSSASIVFGCSNLQSGDLTKPDRAVDGIFGFGQHDLSIISQLSSTGVAPKLFSHCLKGSDNGGGILVLGEIVEPGIVYTPLVQSQSHYNLNLQSIVVNGNMLPIDTSVFATSNNQGTIVDSGTTLTYLAEQAYDPFVNAIVASLPQSVHHFVSKGNQCFVSSSSVDDQFPSVNLNFEGGATMVLRPQDYLLPEDSMENSMIWCIGWLKNQGQGITILGDWLVPAYAGNCRLTLAGSYLVWTIFWIWFGKMGSIVCCPSILDGSTDNNPNPNRVPNAVTAVDSEVIYGLESLAYKEARKILTVTVGTIIGIAPTIC